MKIILTILQLFAYVSIFAQTYGPRNPSTQTTIPGGNVWAGSTTGTFVSDNTYSSVNALGATETLVAKNYGFTLVNTDIITGIQLDIERRGDLGNDVSLLNAWRDGELSTINNFPLSAGNSRMMICFVANENANEPTISNITYGGRSMTKVVGFSFATSFWARLECWYLPESELAMLAPGNYNINVAYAPFTRSEFFDIISAAVFANVDQNNPFFSFQTKQINGGPATCTFDAPITADNGGMFLTGVFSGNNTSPAKTNGQTNTYTINSGFTEGTDVYRSSTASTTSGGCMQTAHKFAPTGGSENPTMTFAGTTNRTLMIGIGLKKYSTVDASVRLLKAGTIVGNNYALTTTQWPLTDNYVTYGGPGDLWGTTWLYSDINNINFGGSLSSNVFNGSARVDHMRMTVYVTSVLPVQLVDFFATVENPGTITTRWLTASENKFMHFEVERSRNGSDFQYVGTVKAVGNSTVLNSYSFEDNDPIDGTSYYRLKQVDIDGTFEYSKIVAVDRKISNELTIAPNPIIDWAKVMSKDLKEAEFMVVNSNGQIIDFSRYDINDDAFMINLKNAPDGNYFLIKNEDGEKSIIRLSKISK